MGDTCCYSFSMGAVKNAIEQAVPGIYVYSIMIGENMVMDEAYGFIGNVNDQVASVCETLKSDPQLAGGFNAVGFSQGSQFLRAYVERCNDPPVLNLITMGGQHQGVADIPGCTSINETVCSLVESALAFGAYNPIAQDVVVQAQYYHDPMDPQAYLQYNQFLPDINNDVSLNALYKENLLKLKNLVLIQFEDDTVVVPKESSWFGFYADDSESVLVPMNQTRLYLEDRIGLRTLDATGRLKFDATPGEHMQFKLSWFNEHVILPYLA
eukprot:TRINITY_DN7179_c0_g1_i1.p1 TRINITY_DN7179_c0_g1~~TRINITY_DN7179_c0_g1_i1.p1  ORF type:complete len:297 (-),score=46.37 TRINITY_DN7179_c0_g1_i1:63-866(-)